MLLSLYRLPQRRVTLAVPAVLVAAFLLGLVVDTEPLTGTIMIAVIVMIFATMVGLRLGELTRLKVDAKLLAAATAINFVWIPLVATAIGFTVLAEHPQLFAGLALAALLPTSGMTIAWTGIQRGDVPAAVRLTVSGLLLGAVLTPWYLLAMIGEFVPIDVATTFQTILTVVVVPLVLGQLATRLLVARYGQQRFQQRIKPNLSPLSVWGMLWVVFVSASSRAETIVANLEVLAVAVAAIVLFYLVALASSTLVATTAFDRDKGIALVNGTALRNLSIAIGIAATQFEAEATVLVTLAFIVQQQGIAYYVGLAGKRWFAEPNEDEEPASNAEPESASNAEPGSASDAAPDPDEGAAPDPSPGRDER